MTENPFKPGTPEHEAFDHQEYGGQELDVFLGVDDAEPSYDWLIPGVLERRDRLILTGGEGDGKSTLLRQLGVQAASGVHPFGGPDYEPLRVLLVDLENSDGQLRRELRPLRAAAGKRYHGGFIVETRLEGLNLLDPEHVEWFQTIATGRKPDMLITGPAYKMVAGDPTEEGPARVVASHLDWARAKFGCAVLLEAHQPHAPNGRSRPDRPYGASLWVRWPEFGLLLTRDGQLRHWRGARDAARQWPVALRRGGEWLWTPGANVPDDEIARLIADLDRLEVPLTTGRVTAREALRKIGVKVRNDTLAEALRLRKDPIRLSAGQSPVSPESEPTLPVPDSCPDEPQNPSSDLSRTASGQDVARAPSGPVPVPPHVSAADGGQVRAPAPDTSWADPLYDKER